MRILSFSHYDHFGETRKDLINIVRRIKYILYFFLDKKDDFFQVIKKRVLLGTLFLNNI